MRRGWGRKERKGEAGEDWEGTEVCSEFRVEVREEQERGGSKRKVNRIYNI